LRASQAPLSHLPTRPDPPDAIAHPVFEDATQRTGHPFRQISPERAAGRVVAFKRLGKGLISGALQIVI
jgi:hypothetical protein